MQSAHAIAETLQKTSAVEAAQVTVLVTELGGELHVILEAATPLNSAAVWSRWLRKQNVWQGRTTDVVLRHRLPNQTTFRWEQRFRLVDGVLTALASPPQAETTTEHLLAGLTQDIQVERATKRRPNRGEQTPPPLQSHQTIAFVLLSVILSANAISQKLTEIVSVSNFLAEAGVSNILGVWIIDGCLLIMLTALQSLLVDRYFRLTLTKVVLLAVAFLFLLCQLCLSLGAPTWVTFALLFLIAQQQSTFVPVVLWTLANDLFDLPQARHLFPKIAAVSFAGSLLGIAAASLMPRIQALFTIGVREIVLFNVGIYLAMVVVMQFGFKKDWIRRIKPQASGFKAMLTEGLDFIKEIPSFRFLTLSLILLFVCDTIIEFRFLAAAGTAMPNVDQFQTFYGLFTFARIGAYTLLQIFLAAKIIDWLSLKNIWLISPIATVLGVVASLGIPNFTGAIAGLAIQKLPLYSIDETARKTFQGLVPEERRGRVSLFMDSYVTAVGSVIGAVIAAIAVFIGVKLGLEDRISYLMLIIPLIFSIAAVIVAVRIRNAYDASMLNWRLKRRQRGRSSVLDSFQ